MTDYGQYQLMRYPQLHLSTAKWLGDRQKYIMLGVKLIHSKSNNVMCSMYCAGTFLL